MAICKDCLHINVCKDYASYDKDSIISCGFFKPKADFEKVVHCKDCVHRNPNCYKCMRDNLWHDKYDFCSYGEKESEVRE